jgi:type I restriction enzyme S subunit
MTTENQTHIPTGWKECELGAIIVEKAKSTIKVSEAANFGEFPFFTSGDNILLHDEKIIEGENLFLATGGVANIKYFDGEAAYSTDTYVICTNEEAKAMYLYYYLLSKVGYINKNYFEGSGLKHLQKKDFRKHVFVLPTSPIEQQKIATVLSKLDEAITQTEQLIEKYKKTKEGLMHDLLTRGIDVYGIIRSEETHKFKDSPLGRIPVEWEVSELGQLSEITSGITLGKRYSTFGTKEMPYLRVANVQDGYFDLREIKTIRIPENQIDKYLLKAGDVLMNEGGDFDKLGRGSVWQEEIKDCLHQNHVFKVRLDKQLMSPQFLALYSASEFGKRFFINESKKSTNLASINKTQLKKFPILNPKLEEQDRIISAINNYSNHINETANNLNKLLSLKSGLMNDLLTGKIRI